MSQKPRQTRKNRPKTPASVQAEKRRHTWAVLGRALLVTVGVPALMLAFILTHDLITQGDYFGLRQLLIDGNDRLSREAVQRQAGIPETANVLALNLTRIRTRLIRHPWIADASVARHLPDRLHIHIREERTKFTLRIDNSLFLVNAEGAIFGETERAAPGTPVITGLGFADLGAGGTLPRTLWRRLSQIIDASVNARPGAALHGARRLEVDRDTGITVYAERGPGVVKLARHSTPHEFELMDRVTAFLKTTNRINAAAALDFRNPARIVATPMPTPKPVHHLKEENHAAKT